MCGTRPNTPPSKSKPATGKANIDHIWVQCLGAVVFWGVVGDTSKQNAFRASMEVITRPTKMIRLKTNLQSGVSLWTLNASEGSKTCCPFQHWTREHAVCIGLKLKGDQFNATKGDLFGLTLLNTRRFRQRLKVLNLQNRPTKPPHKAGCVLPFESKKPGKASQKRQ